MSKFVIIPDSTCDMNLEMQKFYNIPELVPGTVVYPDGKVVEVDGSWTKKDREDFYALLKNKKNVFTTGAPSPEKFAEIFEKYLKEGYDVLSVSISSALSCTYQNACVGAELLKEKYPNNKVLCLDSHRYSTAELLLIIEASKLAKQGKTIDETFELLNKYKFYLHQSGPMDDLMFLASKGRISNGKAFMGQLIGVNPIGEVDRNGLTKVLCRVKGSKKALQVCLEYIKQTIIEPEKQTIVIAHSNRENKALLYKEMIEKEIQPKEIILTDVGQSCAPNIGPGLCAAYYFGKEITDLEFERSVFESLTKKK